MGKVRVINRCIEAITSKGGRHWQVWASNPDGTNHVVAFPKEIFDNLAGEYDIDPSDIDTLLDIALHQGTLPGLDMVPSESLPEEQLVASKTDTMRGPKGTMVPVELKTADTVAQAREVHLARISKAKRDILEYVLPTSPKAEGVMAKAARSALPANPLDVIRQAHRPNSARVEKARSEIRELRRSTLGLPPEPRKAESPLPPDPAYARRTEATVSDPENTEITITPGWVTLELSRERGN